MQGRPEDADIRWVMQVALPDALNEFGVSVESNIDVLLHAVESLDNRCLRYIPVSVLLKEWELRSPGYLHTIGQLRMGVVREKLELIALLFESYRLNPSASVASLVSCLSDPVFDDERRNLQVIDLALAFLAKSHGQRSSDEPRA
ncbi:MAG: hypothetical protein AAF658_17475 [Myxococcota bacterium]